MALTFHPLLDPSAWTISCPFETRLFASEEEASAALEEHGLVCAAHLVWRAEVAAFGDEEAAAAEFAATRGVWPGACEQSGHLYADPTFPDAPEVTVPTAAVAAVAAVLALPGLETENSGQIQAGDLLGRALVAAATATPDAEPALVAVRHPAGVHLTRPSGPGGLPGLLARISELCEWAAAHGTEVAWWRD